MKWTIPYLSQDLATPLLYDIIGIVSVHLYQEGLHYASTSHCKIYAVGNWEILGVCCTAVPPSSK